MWQAQTNSLHLAIPQAQPLFKYHIYIRWQLFHLAPVSPCTHGAGCTTCIVRPRLRPKHLRGPSCCTTCRRRDTGQCAAGHRNGYSRHKPWETVGDVGFQSAFHYLGQPVHYQSAAPQQRGSMAPCTPPPVVAEPARLRTTAGPMRPASQHSSSPHLSQAAVLRDGCS